MSTATATATATEADVATIWSRTGVLVGRGRPVEANVRRTKYGYQVSVPARRGSKHRLTRTFTTEQHARTWARTCVHALYAGEDAPTPESPEAMVGAVRAQMAPISPRPVATFDKVAATWLSAHLNAPGRSEKRREALRSALFNHVAPMMANVGARIGDDLTEADYRAFLDGLAHPPAPTATVKDPAKLVTVAEAVEVTGVSVASIRRHIHAGTLPGAHIDADSGLWLIPMGDLAADGLLEGKPRKRGPRTERFGHSSGQIVEIRRVLDRILELGVANYGWTLQFDPKTIPTPAGQH